MATPLGLYDRVFRRREVIWDCLNAATALGLGVASDGLSAPRQAASTVLVENLGFPEGVITFRDGQFGCVEIAHSRLALFDAVGNRLENYNLGGGPNGSAIGPDGNIYVANNGGLSFEKNNGGYRLTGVPDTYKSGSIQRVDLESGSITTLYDQWEGVSLKGPNDIVFADASGFWFTDTGKFRNGVMEEGALYWASVDGREIRRAVYPLNSPNGIALSPDRKTLYVALSSERRIASFEITSPGRLNSEGMQILCTLPGNLILDNIAVEETGNLIVATVIEGGLTTISPDGRLLDRIPLPDFSVTALAFGGPEFRNLYVALSTTGKIISLDWPRIGLQPLFRPSCRMI